MTSPKIIQEIGSKVSYTETQNLTNDQKLQVRTNIGAVDNSSVVSITGAQTISGAKTFSASPIVPTPNADDDSQNAVNTAWVTDILESDLTAFEGIASGQDPTSEPLLQPSNIVTVNGAQTITGVKTFSSSPIVPTPTSGDDTQKIASTAFVKTAIDNSVNSVKAVSYAEQTLTNEQKAQARSNIGATSASDVQSALDAQAVQFDSVQNLTDAQKQQARTNIGSADDSEVVKLSNSQTISGDKNFTGLLQHNGYGVDAVVSSGANYIRYESGLQIIFGYFTIPAGTKSVTVTYPMPFITSASVTVSVNQYDPVGVYSRTATTFNPSMNQTHSGTSEFYYIAIGYWK